VALLKKACLLLKLSKGVDTALFETEFTCANKAFWTMPIIFRNPLDWWVKAVSMIAGIAAVA
jgi:hypothetical protein